MGSRATAFRISVFTGIGYLSTVIEPTQHGPWMTLQGEGTELNLFGVLANAKIGLPGTPAAAPLLDALEVPTVIDRDPSFPVLVESGSISMARGGAVFTPNGRARRMLTFAFDRGFSRFLRTIQGRNP